MKRRTLLSGRLAHDPEIRYTPGGLATSYFPLEFDKGGGRKAEIGVRCTGELAENLALSLVKGHRVCVAGRLVQNCELGEATRVGDPLIVLWADEVAASMVGATVEVATTTRQPDYPANPEAKVDEAQWIIEAEELDEREAEFVFEMAATWGAGADNLLLAARAVHGGVRGV